MLLNFTISLVSGIESRELLSPRRELARLGRGGDLRDKHIFAAKSFKKESFKKKGLLDCIHLYVI